MYFYYKLDTLHFLVKTIRNLDLVEKWISRRIYSKKTLKVTWKLCSLLNVGTISDETAERINNLCLSLKKRWEACSRNPHCLLKRHRVWLRKETNIQDISTEPKNSENTNKDRANRLSRRILWH